jgi:D-sedoheptulose 7-phosphate isomerase
MNKHLAYLTSRYPELSACVPDIEETYRVIETSFKSGGKLLVCGNGGSAADSDHIVGELMKGFMLKRPVPEEFRVRLAEVDDSQAQYIADRLQGALPAISLVSHSALYSAFANDVAADLAFAQGVYGYGRPGDVVLGLSTSGNSANVLHAIRTAKALGMKSIGLTGSLGGTMNGLCDVTIRVPFESTPEVQERHLPIYHTLCIMLEEEFFG